MDYHSEVEIHERDDGGIVLDIHAKKNRGGETEDLKWNMDRKKPAIVRLENRRQVFFRDSGVIGVVTSRKIKPNYRINFHKVKFRRQRGHKVGRGGLIHCLHIE
eukprot:XP_019921088.1 PREDICTED: uncharacterized protein LOC105324303 [Crassostrea gigas]